MLGVPKNASFSEIQKAYRDLALKYHPKNNSDPKAEQKFIEINEAYNHLSDQARRRNYDDYKFGELVPLTSHRIFNDFFNTNPFLQLEDERLFRPIITKTASDIQKEL
jgi:DnaJ-class molecular chaperone